MDVFNDHHPDDFLIIFLLLLWLTITVIAFAVEGFPGAMFVSAFMFFLVSLAIAGIKHFDW